MNVAFDVDVLLDAAPAIMQSFCSALVAAGHHVYVITGVEADTVTPTDIVNKTRYLTGLGFGKGTFTQVIVVPDPHPENKAKAIEDNKIEVLFDNNIANIKASKTLCACFLLWNNKVKK